MPRWLNFPFNMFFNRCVQRQRQRNARIYSTITTTIIFNHICLKKFSFKFNLLVFSKSITLPFNNVYESWDFRIRYRKVRDVHPFVWSVLFFFTISRLPLRPKPAKLLISCYQNTKNPYFRKTAHLNLYIFFTDCLFLKFFFALNTQ